MTSDPGYLRSAGIPRPLEVGPCGLRRPWRRCWGLGWPGHGWIRSVRLRFRRNWVVHDAGPGAEEMVVVVRGFRPIAGLWRCPERHPGTASQRRICCSSTFPRPRSPTGSVRLASELEAAIAEQDRTNHYQRILISGHGMGALLARKAYLYGCGSVEDLNYAGDAATSQAPTVGVSKVDRIVLLARLNRGWDLDGRTTGRDWPDRPAPVDLMLARLTGDWAFPEFRRERAVCRQSPAAMAVDPWRRTPGRTSPARGGAGSGRPGRCRGRMTVATSGWRRNSSGSESTAPAIGTCWRWGIQGKAWNANGRSRPRSEARSI